MNETVEAGFGVYIHWPFCESKCPYCDFNSHVARGVDQARWLAALGHEIARNAERMPDAVVRSIFFGGGTPSLMLPETVHGLIEAVRRSWRLANAVEITMEANPGSVEAARFAGYRDAGVNRISIGVQALRDDDLRRLGRLHDVAQARRAIEIAQATFARVSLDLIYARQDQEIADWEAELTLALGLGTSHLSLYQLTIEDGTAFGDRFAAGRLSGLPDADRGADMYERTQAICADAGLPAYEVSNHARPGEECAHNLIYWTAGTYAGIGPGAHGRIAQAGARIETEAIRAPGAWLSAVETAGNGEFSPRAMSPREAAEEYLMMGLRIREGVSPGRLGPLVEAPDWAARVAMLEEAGMLVTDGGRLRATPAGMLLLNSVLRHLVA